MTSDQLQVGQSPYRAFITREPFLFYEMRVTAKLLSQGASDEEALRKIMEENLFQYPTEKTIRRIARACMIRLHGLNDDSLTAAIAQQPQDEAKQLCLYALMKQHRLVPWSWYFVSTPLTTLPTRRPLWLYLNSTIMPDFDI